MNRSYTPIRPFIRCILAAAAVAATLASGALVDGLARAYAPDALQAAATQRLASAGSAH